MKHILLILCFTMTYLQSKSQISMQTNLPKTVSLNSEVTFDVKIKKGASANFAKYQMEIPRGSIIKEVDVKSGSFALEEDIVKIIWVMAPSDSIVTISLKLITGVVPGKKTFSQKYFYIEKDNKREIEMEPISVTYRDSSVSGSSLSTEEFYNLVPKALPSLLTTTINSAEISTKNPEILKQQVLQLKKDSKDAYEVGEKERRKAELKISEANTAIANAEAMTNETEKKQALEKANGEKKKAETDLEIAERVLTLAKSLDDNANEIETINRSINPESYSAKPASVATNNNPTETSTTTDLGKAEENSSGKAKKGTKKSKSDDVETVFIESGLIYVIQLGAFSKTPSRSDFKAVGKVKIKEENGMYKVLYGSYPSKEEAFKQREQIIAKGFDAFIVLYQDGVRVK